MYRAISLTHDTKHGTVTTATTHKRGTRLNRKILSKDSMVCTVP